MIPIPQVVRITNATAQTIGARGYGFRLEPLTNAATGNPVQMAATVRLNRNAAMSFPISDDGARYYGEPFEVLELVDGNVDDRWLVTVYESQSDGVGAPARVKPQPAVIAAKSDFSVMGDYTYGQEYALPTVNGAVQAATLLPDPFDVTEFTHLVLMARNEAVADEAAPGSAPNLHVEVVLLAGAESDVQVGAVKLDVPVGQTGVIHLGPGVVSSADVEGGGPKKAVSQRYPYVRVTYKFTDPAPGAEQQPDNNSEIRLVGMR
jgi:hypothetical protein